jgi:DNA-binding NarL/FixJ family response regulator
VTQTKEYINTWELTSRQIEILQLMASEQLTAKEIGYRLGVSHKTVEVHVDRLLTRMGAKNRTHAVLMWDRAQRQPAQPPVIAPAGYAHCMYCEGRGFLKGAA